MTKKDGGPAFPMVGQIDEFRSVAITGMTLRDWFAGQALAGVMEKYAYVRPEANAKEAYALADAMIAQREKE
jgi:hypothetical protein